MTEKFINAHSEVAWKGGEESTVGVSMSGGFFYGQSKSVFHYGDGRVAVLPLESVGPFDTSRDAVARAQGRISDTVNNQAYTKRDHALAIKFGPGSTERLEYHPFPIEREEMNHHRDITHTTRRFHSISADATDEGKDPLSVFRRAAARGEVDMDDPRQLAAAYTHPNPKIRVPMPAQIDEDPFKAIREMTPGQQKRKLMVKSAALRKERDGGGSKAAFAQKMEEFGVSLAKQGETTLAVSCFVNAFQNAREHTRERGPDIRVRPKIKATAER